MSDTTADLRQVIRRLEAKSRAMPSFRRSGSLEDLLGGAVEETEKGAVLCVRRRFAQSHHHGRQPIDAAREMAQGPLALLARVERQIARLPSRHGGAARPGLRAR